MDYTEGSNNNNDGSDIRQSFGPPPQQQLGMLRSPLRQATSGGVSYRQQISSFRESAGGMQTRPSARGPHVFPASSAVRESEGPEGLEGLEEEEVKYERRRLEAIRMTPGSQNVANQIQQLQPQLRPQSANNVSQTIRNGNNLRALPVLQQPAPFSLGPQPQIPLPQLRTLNLPQNTPVHIREHISHLQQDNAGLLRRLNTVHQELQRLAREKNQLQHHLTQSMQETQVAYDALQGEDNLDKVNKYMKDDLLYERDRNAKLSKQVEDSRKNFARFGDDLKRIESDQERLIRENQETSYMLQKTISECEDLEREQVFNVERITDTGISAEQSGIQCSHIQQEIFLIRQNIEALIGERNDIINRINDIARQYELTVHQMTEERRGLEIQNAQHVKIATASLLFNTLSLIHKQRLQTGFQEIFSYTQFDNKCNQKLKFLAKLMGKVGQQKLKIALTHWFSSALKPIEVMDQSKLVSLHTGRLILVQKFYRAWRNLYHEKINSYDQKTQSIHLIWGKLSKEAKVEKQRALRIWKELFNKFKLQKYKLKRILWKKFFKSASCAFNAWENYTSYFDAQLRLNLLAVDYSHQQQLSILFHSFHLRTSEKRNIRHSTLRHCLSGWKHYLNQQKYLMSQNLIATKFNIEVFTSTIKASFDALKFYKQKKLLSKIAQSLMNEGDNIADLNLIIRDLVDSNYLVMKSRACNAIKVALQKRVWSYISHWRQHNLDFQESKRTTLRDLSVKLYLQWARVSFKRWRLRHSQEVHADHKHEISTLQGEQRTLQNDVITEQNDIRDKSDELTQKQQRHLNKCIKAFEKRLISIATGRWRDKVASFEEKERGASIITRRLRLRLGRKAFDLYIEGVKHQKTLELHYRKYELYMRTRHNRLSQKVLDSWVLFKKNHIRAKNYWYRIFLRLDMSQKRQIVKKWRENTQKLTECSLESCKQDTVDTIDSLNHQIGQLHAEETDQQKIIGQKNHLLITQGQRILANAFARFYYINQCRGLEKWKEHVSFEKRKERLLEKSISHIHKSQFYVVKSSFKNWIHKIKYLEITQDFKKECMKATDTLFQTKLLTEQNTDHSQQLVQAIEEEEVETNILKAKHSNIIVAIRNRVNDNHFMKRKQYIFQTWSKYVKREVFFITCIKNIMQKSLWDQGFQAIKQASRSSHKSDVSEALLTKFFQGFQKRVLLNAFSNWRASDYRKVTYTVRDTLLETQTRDQRHETRKSVIKEYNSLRSEKLITDFLKRNVLKAWSNVSTYLKIEKEKTLLCRQEVKAQQQRQAIIKWRSRQLATQKRRATVLKVKEMSHSMRTKMVFTEMKVRYFRQKELMMRLSNLARTVDHCQIQMGYHAIVSFAKAKAFAQAKRKENATIWFAETLSTLFKRKQSQYLSDLRSKCLTKRRQETLQKTVLNVCHVRRIRDFFITWREQTQKLTLSKELYEEGPVREQDFNYKSELRNIKDMLKEEGYDGDDMDVALKQHESQNRFLLLKAVRRMQHYNEDLYVLPKMFDRWRAYVHMRKLYRYWLQFAEKRRQLIKSDLHYCFDRWKRFHPVKHQHLTVKNKKDLNKRAIENSKNLDKLSEDISDKEIMLDHLNAQRETLLDNYIKSQKLALATCDAQNKHSIHAAFSQWLDDSQRQRNYISKTQLKSNLAHLEALKERIKLLETQNEQLGTENEELRQFSLDGYDIAKNVQILTSEREVLSVDLADKAQVIRKLLDENEVLTLKLEKAQQHAEGLIRQTMRRGCERPMSGSQTFARNSYR